MLLISSEKKTNWGREAKESSGWEFVIHTHTHTHPNQPTKQASKQVSTCRLKHPKLLWLLEAESLITSQCLGSGVTTKVDTHPMDLTESGIPLGRPTRCKRIFRAHIQGLERDLGQFSLLPPCPFLLPCIYTFSHVYPIESTARLLKKDFLLLPSDTRSSLTTVSFT